MQDFIPISNYNYVLPESRIASFPLSERDKSKLLVLKDGAIHDSSFYDLANEIPEKSLFIFNDTRVIKARLIFHKQGGARIEIFCLEEISHGEDYSQWQCYVGNSKKWKSGDLLLNDAQAGLTLTATRTGSDNDTHLITFHWNKPLSFEQVLEVFGKVPLPPYIHRETVEDDRERYQTIYAKYDGSVAAPTAGLHFTSKVFNDLEAKGCSIDYLTLHVGAGTFKPVTAENAIEHSMHEEKVIIHRDTLLMIIQNLDKTIISVGTTSMRSLESLYWAGLQVITSSIGNLTETNRFFIDQFEPYQAKGNISAYDALTTLHDHMRNNNLTEITGSTRIMIMPGYKFRVCNALVTNFHQPQSTLLLLVAAFIGPQWRDVYNHALKNDYRFLSYGDSCLFFRPEN